MDIKVVTVATHNERFFDSFIYSCKKYNTKPVILGWGDKYTGHLMKDDLLLEYLDNNKENNIILFVDAFDCLLIRNINLLKNKFKKTGHRVIISMERNIKTGSNLGFIYSNFQNLFFGSIDSNIINTGMIIGYRDDLVRVLNEIKKYREIDINSNQRIWTKAINSSIFLKDLIHIDIEQMFFKNFDMVSKQNTITFKNNMVYIKETNTYPFVVQGNGYKNMNFICNKMRIKQSAIVLKNRVKYSGNFIYYYIYPYLKYCLLVFCLIIVLLKTKKDFRFN
jgi:hypothetical protein